MVFGEAGSENVIESGGSEILEAWVVAPGEAVFLWGFIPCVIETGFDHILDSGAEGELAVVIGIEIATDDPADDFLVGVFFGGFIFVSDDLFDGLGAGGGDDLFHVRFFAATIAAEVNAVGHDQSAVGMFECGEGETAIEAGKVFDEFEGNFRCAVGFEFGCDGALLQEWFFVLEIQKFGHHMDFQIWVIFDECFESSLVADFLSEEDIGICGSDDFLCGVDVLALFGLRGFGVSTGKPFDVPSHCFDRFCGSCATEK